MQSRPASPWWTLPLAFGAFCVLAILERRRPLRQATELKLRREARNLTIAGLGAAVMQLAEAPAVAPILRRNNLQPSGLRRILPPVLIFLLMDYTMYLWHALMHRIPLFWRFHFPHHSDLDMDASTALRFHFGELLLSIPWRVAQLFFLGSSSRQYQVWQSAFLAAIVFHHSSFRLPLRLESFLCQFLVTPRMHAIHHSIVLRHSHSNYSSILSIWDRLHGTLTLNVPQSQLTIGVPELRHPAQVTLVETLASPFQERP